MLLKGNCPLKMEQHLAMKLSSIFEFQPASLSFSVILEDIFIVSLSYSMRKGEFFPKKLFIEATDFDANWWGFCFTWDNNDQIKPRRRGEGRGRGGGRGGVLQNEFFSNLNTKSENFSKPWWNIQLKKKSPDHSIELLKDLSLRLIVRRFQRLYHII